MAETRLVLRSAEVEVVVLPDKGCDIYSWTDLPSGVDVLFKTPWGLSPASAPAADSMTAWLSRYPGGWQVLCPNGGAESEAPGGVRWGFHGEACLVPWDVLASGPGRVELTVRLHTAPLRLHRRITLSGRLLIIDESVTNTSPDDVEFMWSHHPAFGAPFLGPDTVLSTGARTVVADDEAPGTLLAPGSHHPWPHASTTDGAALDLSVLPPAPAAQLAYLTDFTDGWFAITNTRLGSASSYDGRPRCSGTPGCGKNCIRAPATRGGARRTCARSSRPARSLARASPPRAARGRAWCGWPVARRGR